MCIRDSCDVVLMVIDASEGLTDQDKKIAGYADEAGKGMILVINKWDLIEKDNNTLHQMEKQLRAELGFLAYAPIVLSLIHISRQPPPAGARSAQNRQKSPDDKA